MNIFIVFTLLVLTAECAKVNPLNGLTEEQAFNSLIKTYKKFYASEKEYEHRFNVFKSNLKIIEELNAKDPEAVYGINEFADLSSEEFSYRYRLQNFSELKMEMEENGLLNELPTIPTNKTFALPASYDWNSKGCVTGVYQQGTCGSCWAFGATENLETAACIVGKGLKNLSQQELLDCVTNGNCKGGYPSSALAYGTQNGMMSSQSYPYTGYKGNCRYNSANVVQRYKGWAYVDKSRNENTIKNWVYSSGAPVVCVDSKTWQFYKGGVVSSNCGTAIDHIVQITGWTTVGNIVAWKVRNSWGSSWGTSGYMYIAIGYNLCAIAQEVITATI